MAMVQTVDQYILVHRAVRELFLEQLRVIDSHPYENVDDEGNPLGRNSDGEAPDYEAIFVKHDSLGKDFLLIRNDNVNLIDLFILYRGGYRSISQSTGVPAPNGYGHFHAWSRQEPRK